MAVEGRSLAVNGFHGYQSSHASPITIGDAWLDWYPWKPLTASDLPSTAIDRGSRYFKDRTYVTWADRRSGRDQIFFTFSSDKGQHWASPRIISDDSATVRGASAPDHLQPSVAVNKDGVVGVAWLDRRQSKDNIGWRARFRASLDGGETWLPSVPVAEQATDPANPAHWVPVVHHNVPRAGAAIQLNIMLFSHALNAGDTDAM